MLEQLPPELAAALGRVPFARTPGRERRGPLLERNDRAQRNKRIRWAACGPAMSVHLPFSLALASVFTWCLPTSHTLP